VSEKLKLNLIIRKRRSLLASLTAGNQSDKSISSVAIISVLQMPLLAQTTR
jgi:hypothetical protein